MTTTSIHLFNQINQSNMDPQHFPEVNKVYAKSQPQYRPLPVCETPTETPGILNYTCRYELNEMEIAQIVREKAFYIEQVGNCLHPICPRIESPFLIARIEWLHDDGFYVAWIPQKDGSVKEVAAASADSLITAVLEDYPAGTTAQNLWFVDKPLLGVDETGKIIDI